MTPALPVFVINLQRQAERRQHMTALLDRLGMAAEFVNAVDGQALTPGERAAYDPARARRVYGVEMRDGEIACCHSHNRIYARMVRDRIETALILEDDVTIDARLPGVISELLASPFRDWDVIRLDCKRGRVIDPPSPKFRGRQVLGLSDGAGLFRLQTHVLGVGAYLIRQEGAARMLKYAERIFMPIDQMMDRFWENGIIPYVVRPFPVHQGDEFGSHAGDRSLDQRRVGQPFAMKQARRLQRMVDGLSKRLFNLRN